MENNWRQKTIENLEKQNYGDPKNAPTDLVRKCLELCRTPLDHFTVENLRLMIGQEFSLKYLIPMAIEFLKEDIFIEGDLFPGDLLKNVLSIDPLFWKNHTLLWREIEALIEQRREDIHKLNISDAVFYDAFSNI